MLQQITQEIAATARRTYAALEVPPDQECQAYLIQRPDLFCCVAFLPGNRIAVGPVAFFHPGAGLGMPGKITVKDGLITRFQGVTHV